MEKRIVLLLAVVMMALTTNAQLRHSGNILLTTLGETKDDTLLSKLVKKVGDRSQEVGADLKFENGKLTSFTFYNIEMNGYQPYDDVWPFGLDSNMTKDMIMFAFGKPGMEMEPGDELTYQMPGVDIRFTFDGQMLAKGTFSWADDYKQAGKSVELSEIKNHLTERFKRRIYANGDCVEGDCQNGEGTMEWENGLQYQGEWKNKFAHGQGRLDYPKGGYYEGAMEFGYPHGEGEEKTSSGRVWKGGFKMGKRHGEGVYTIPDGTKMEGSYEDGTMQGEWVITYPQGQTRTVQYKDGKMVR